VTAVTCALGPDCAGTLLHGLLEAPVSRLDAAVYEVGPSYGWLFPRAVERGARVRVLLNGHGGDNRGCLDQLRRAADRGVHVPCRVRRHDGLREAHWKLIVADDGLAVGTGNLIARDAPADRHGRLPPEADPLSGTREWWAFVDGAPTLAQRARAHVTAAWRDSVPPPPLWTVDEGVPVVPPVGSPTPAVAPLTLELSPRRLHLSADARAVRAAITAALEGRVRRCLLTVPYIHTWAHEVRPLIERLAELHRRGSDVRVLLGAAPAGGDAAALRDRHIPTRVMSRERCTTGHAKGMVVDSMVLIMSANWSAAGLGASLESGLRIDDPAASAYFADAFDRDWEVGDGC